MSYRLIIGAVCLIATVAGAREPGQNVPTGLTGPVFATQDPRDCVYPLCGGYFLRDSAEEACSGAFMFQPERYATRIVIRQEDGTLTPLYPACSDFLMGSFEPDPEFPQFPELRMFALCPFCNN